MDLSLILGFIAALLLIVLAIISLVDLKNYSTPKVQLQFNKGQSFKTLNRLEIIRELSFVKPHRSDLALLKIANKYSWSSLIVSCLPKLYFTDISKSEIITSLVWKEVINLVPPNFEYRVIQKYCDGEIIKISMDMESHLFINRLALLLEEARLNTPYSSHMALLGVINQYLNSYELEIKNSKNEQLANDIQFKRKTLLQDEMHLCVN